MTATPMISLRQVRKSFGSFQAIDEVSFDVGRGDFFSLLGPSGCGKTTLLRMIAGFESPSNGEIFIDDQPMTGVPANRRPTNMVFQNYAIFPHLSVRRNVSYGLRNRHLTRREAEEKVSRALAMIQMSDYGDRRPTQLSGGQRQRVALARALVCDPKVLLLDEPLGALDKKLRSEMQIELRRIQRSVGITFVLVTHDQEEALALSDRIAVIKAGRALQIGSANELYEQPRSRAVAEFIGTMNFLSARVEGEHDGHLLVSIGRTGRLAVVGRRSAALADLSLAIRPEKIRLDWTGPTSARTANGDGTLGVLAGRVTAVSYLGDRYHYRVAVPGLHDPIWVASQTSKRSLTGSSAEERPVWLTLPPEALLPMDDG